MQTKRWWFDVTISDGRIERDFRVDAVDEDTAYEILYSWFASLGHTIAATHLQHANGKVRR